MIDVVVTRDPGRMLPGVDARAKVQVKAGDRLVTEVITVAKKNLKAGEILDGRNVSMKMRHRLREFSVENSRFP